MSDNLVLEQLRAIRRENADIRSLVLALVDQGRRQERRFSEFERRFSEFRTETREIKDDIELMLKAEIMGRLGNFETRLERQIEELAERTAALEAKP